MEEVRISAKVDVAGLEEAVNRFGKFSGSINDTERAFRQIGVTAQDAVKAGGYVTPDQMEKMTRNLDTLKRAEGEINRLIEERKRSLEEINQKVLASFGPGAQRVFQQARAQGEDPWVAIRSVFGAPGEDVAPELQKARRLESEIARLETQRARVQEGLPQAEMLANTIGTKMEGALDRWLPKFGNILRMSLSVVGIGGAFGILADARNRGREFYMSAADMGMFLGRSPGDIENLALTGRSQFGLMPQERLDIVRSLAGGYGTRPSGTVQGRFAGLGLAFGLGREGYARMAGEMALTAFPGGEGGEGQAEQFGRLAFSVGQRAALTPGQKQIFLESNKNLVELLVRWYGGRPLNVEDYFKGVAATMTVVRDLGLAGAGAPFVRQISEAVMGGFSPIGKAPGDIVKLGLAMGVDVGAAGQGPGGVFFEVTKAILDKLRGPGGAIGAIQSLANLVGIETGPGANITGGQMTALYPVARNLVGPEFAAALQQSFNAGALGRILTAQPGTQQELGPDAQQELERLRKLFEDSIGGKARSADAEFVAEEIRKLSPYLITIESTLKEMLGPQGAIVAAILASALLQVTPMGAALVVGGGTLAYLANKLATSPGEAKKRKEMGLLTGPMIGGEFVPELAPIDPDLVMKKQQELKRAVKPGESEALSTQQERGAFMDFMTQTMEGLMGTNSPLASELRNTQEELRRLREETEKKIEGTVAGRGVRPGVNRPRGP